MVQIMPWRGRGVKGGGCVSRVGARSPGRWNSPGGRYQSQAGTSGTPGTSGTQNTAESGVPCPWEIPGVPEVPASGGPPSPARPRLGSLGVERLVVGPAFLDLVELAGVAQPAEGDRDGAPVE